MNTASSLKLFENIYKRYNLDQDKIEIQLGVHVRNSKHFTEESDRNVVAFPCAITVLGM